MQIGKRNFPYPVINKIDYYNDYNNTSFEFLYEDEMTEKYYILKNVKINIQNEQIISLIKENKLAAVIVIECKSTLYKHTEVISLEPKEIKIHMNNLKDKVEVSCYVYSTEKLKNFTNYDFLSDYNSYSFDIEKYCILAIDDGFSMKIDYDDSLDKKVSSIFSVVKLDDEKNEELDEKVDIMSVVMEDKKIRIYLPSQQYGIYERLKNRNEFNNIFFSILLIPALSNCLNEVQKFDSIEDIIEQYTWFNSICFVYKKENNQELDIDTFKNVNTLELAQSIMKGCIVSSISDLADLIEVSNEEEEE